MHGGTPLTCNSLTPPDVHPNTSSTWNAWTGVVILGERDMVSRHLNVHNSIPLTANGFSLDVHSSIPLTYIGGSKNGIALPLMCMIILPLHGMPRME